MPQIQSRRTWLQPSIIPFLAVVAGGIFVTYARMTSPAEFLTLESFPLENELILFAYCSFVLAALSWWLMFVFYGKGAYYTKNHIWPSPFTAGALASLAICVLFVITILGSDEDLVTKNLGFVVSAAAASILCLKDHQQLMRYKKSK